MKLKENSVVGIIDSGIGGISILKQLINKFGYGNYIYFADNANMPYGSKEKEFIKDRVNEIINTLKSKYNASIIIVACNTASSLLNKKRKDDIMLLSFDKNKIYLATPLTKFNLKGYKVIADETLANEIEQNIFNENELLQITKTHIKDLGLSKIKNLCLGCTHYELIGKFFKKLLPKTQIEYNSDTIIKSIEMEKCKELNVVFLTSRKDENYTKTLRKIAFSKD